MLFLAALGCGLCGLQLSVRDEPTAPGVSVSGTVSAIERDFRVCLEDVTAENAGPFRRPVMVTLMLEEEETREMVRIGQRVSGTGRLFAQDEARNPGTSGWRIPALSDGYELSGYILPGWKAEGDARFSLGEWFRALRVRIGGAIDGLFGEHAALFKGIMLGDKRGIEEETLRAMRLTGTVHVLTVSGMHLSLMAAVLDALLRFMHAGRMASFAVKMTALTFFTCLTGGAPGTLRALIMALMHSLARICGRRYDTLTSLALAALLIALICPVMVLTASFQLSFGIVFGLVLFRQPIEAVFRRLLPERIARSALIRSAAVSMGAQISAAPMQLYFYGYIPLLSLGMNMLCSLAMPALMLGGWCIWAVGCAAPEAAKALAAPLVCLADVFERMSMAAAQWEWAIVRLPAPGIITLLLFALSAVLLSGVICFGAGRRRAAVAAMLLTALTYAFRFDPAARYVQIDVGQGDAAVIRSGRNAVLVDVGPADCYDVLRYLRHEGLFVDCVILSHLDEDHAGALGVLMDSEVGIGQIVMPVIAGNEGPPPQEVLLGFEAAAKAGVLLREVQRGEEIDLGFVRFDVLSPHEGLSGSNERSLLLLGSIQGKRILTTGDLPKSSEPESIPVCDILKVAHHGSKNAGSEAFVAQASPQLALISVGARNSYGHPTQETLARLDRVGAKVYRTDESGCITVWLGEELHVETMFD